MRLWSVHCRRKVSLAWSVPGTHLAGLPEGRVEPEHQKPGGTVDHDEGGYHQEQEDLEPEVLQQYHQVHQQASPEQGVREVQSQPGKQQERVMKDCGPGGENVGDDENNVDSDGQREILTRVLNDIGSGLCEDKAVFQSVIICVDEPDNLVDLVTGLVEDDEVCDEEDGVEDEVEDADQDSAGAEGTAASHPVTAVLWCDMHGPPPLLLSWLE